MFLRCKGTCDRYFDACMQNDFQTVKALHLQYLNACDSDSKRIPGFYAIHYAAHFGYKDIFKFLIKSQFF